VNDIERDDAIRRIARNLERFDNDTLAEMARLTDPDTRELRPADTAPLTRRQLLLGFAAGSATMALAAVGVSAVRGASSRDDDSSTRPTDAPGAAAEVSSADGSGGVGAALTEAERHTQSLTAGIRDVGPELLAALALVDPALGPRFQERILGPAAGVAGSVADARSALASES
jgi:hypothetical protein